ncbi:MAG: hypothetical protein ACNYVW_06305, partial [Methanosarcinales archaeon]
ASGRGGRYNVSIVGGKDENRDTDKLIAELATKLDAAVFTIDDDLKQELTHAGVQTVYLRGRNRLEVSE